MYILNIGQSTCTWNVTPLQPTFSSGWFETIAVLHFHYWSSCTCQREDNPCMVKMMKPRQYCECIIGNMYNTNIVLSFRCSPVVIPPSSIMLSTDNPFLILLEGYLLAQRAGWHMCRFALDFSVSPTLL